MYNFQVWLQGVETPHYFDLPDERLWEAYQEWLAGTIQLAERPHGYVFECDGTKTAINFHLVARLNVSEVHVDSGSPPVAAGVDSVVDQNPQGVFLDADDDRPPLS